MDLAKIRKKARLEKGGRASQEPEERLEASAPPPPSSPETATLEIPPPPAGLSADSSGAGETDGPSVAARSDTAAPAPSKKERLLIFSIETEKYAIPIHEISLIIEPPHITPIPNCPDYLLGIVSLRGKVVSIIDVASRLSLQRLTAPTAPKIVILDMGTDQFGLYVDGIDQLVEVALTSLETPPEGFTQKAQDFVEGVFHHKDRAVAYLNLPAFLSFRL
ncbi:MAG: chemotaxis protein CheW [Acidobacteriota bacterium]